VVFRIRKGLIRTRIRGSIPLIITDPDPDPTKSFHQWLLICKKDYIFSYFLCFLLTADTFTSVFKDSKLFIRYATVPYCRIKFLFCLLIDRVRIRVQIITDSDPPIKLKNLCLHSLERREEMLELLLLLLAHLMMLLLLLHVMLLRLD
jgi:hypothetical protein